MEGIRKRVNIVETDNRDVYTTDLVLDNGTVVEVDVQDLFENMIENVSEDTVENYSVDELLEMFKSLKDLINY
tara:strand:+ start:1407 stop:1625 length:219 start_codon:yes stop_codon:yes gene_type:complete